MYTYKCIKPDCGKQYQSDDVEAYYCTECLQAKEALAKQVDAQIASRPKKQTKSDLEMLEQGPKIHGFYHVKL